MEELLEFIKNEKAECKNKQECVNDYFLKIKDECKKLINLGRFLNEDACVNYLI